MGWFLSSLTTAGSRSCPRPEPWPRRRRGEKARTTRRESRRTGAFLASDGGRGPGLPDLGCLRGYGSSALQIASEQRGQIERVDPASEALRAAALTSKKWYRSCPLTTAPHHVLTLYLTGPRRSPTHWTI